MAIFDKYLVNSFLRSETTTDPIPTAFYSENFATNLGDFTTSGDVVWTRVIDDGNGDLFSARSGAITHDEQSILQLVKITTQYSTLLRYDYKTSTEEDFDYLHVKVNGVVVARHSGTNAWTTNDVYIHGIGSQTIQFIYYRDSSDGGGTNQVWVDNVGLYNYSESAVSNTATLFKEQVVFNNNLISKGFASFNGIQTNFDIEGFNNGGGRLFRQTLRDSGTVYSQYSTDYTGSVVEMGTLTSNSYISVKNPIDLGEKIKIGVNFVGDLSNGYIQTNSGSYIRLGEFAGADLTKILVVNGESEFRESITIGSVGNAGTINLRRDTDAGSTGLIGLDATSGLRIKNVGGGSYITFQTNTVTDAVRIIDNGNVGIGTTTPSTKLDIRPDDLWSNCAINFTSNAQNPTIRLYRPTGSGTASYPFHIRVGGASSSNLEIASGGSAENGAETVTTKLAITNGGNVGIGTTSPDGKLHIDGVSASVTGLVLEVDGAVSNNRVIDIHNTGGAMRFGFEYDNNSIKLNIVDQNRDKLITFQGNGNIGINDSTPSYKLDVNGTGRFTDVLRSEKFIQITEAGTTLNEGKGIGYLVTDEFANIGNDSVTRYLNHYGWGIHKPLNATSGGRGTYMSGYFGMDFYTSGINRMHINQGGNISIGNTNNTHKLDVSGEIHSSTYVSATNGLGVDSTSMGNGRGLSLYGGPQLYAQYGILFATTADLGTHGNVDGDYAIYNTVNNIAGRGFIWKGGTVNSTDFNVASISAQGEATFDGGLKVSGYAEPLPTAIYSDDFESAFGVEWTQTPLSDTAWTREATGGNPTGCANSGVSTPNRGTSGLRLTQTTVAESTLLQFDYKTSTESGFDYFIIQVDDRVVWREKSGTIAWTTSPDIWIHGIGSHTIDFIFSKDNNSTGGTDEVWIDNVALYSREEKVLFNTPAYFNDELTTERLKVEGIAYFQNTVVFGGIRHEWLSGGDRRAQLDNTSGGSTFTQYGGNNNVGISNTANATNNYSRYYDLTTDLQVNADIGTNSTYTGGYLNLPRTNTQVRFGEAMGSDTSHVLAVNGKTIFRGYVRMMTYSVTALGFISPKAAGDRCFVSDAINNTFNSVVAGGGSNFLPVFYDGTNWRIG